MNLKILVENQELIEKLYNEKGLKGRTYKFYRILQAFKDALETRNLAVQNFMKKHGDINQEGRYVLSIKPKPPSEKQVEAMQAYEESREIVREYQALMDELDESDAELLKFDPIYGLKDKNELQKFSLKELGGLVKLGLVTDEVLMELDDERDEEEDGPKKAPRKKTSK